MPGMSYHERVGTVVEIMSSMIGKVRFGDGTEVLLPFKNLR